MRREAKEAKIALYDGAVEQATFAVLLEFDKLSVAKVDKFRNDLAALGYGVIVLKNTLAKIVFDRHGLSDVAEYLVGPSLLVYGSGEVSPVAKQVSRSMREFPALVLKGILFDGQVYPKSDFQLFTTMPTKDEVRARLLSVLKAPLSQFVTVVNAPQRLAMVLKAYCDKAAEG
jgi:large subunit ribosomal protein L10